MSAKRISEFPELVVPQALAEALIAYQGTTYRFKLGNITGLIPLPTKAQIGLGNVDNTSDNAKPVSAAQQAALDLKADAQHTHTQSEIVGLVSTLGTFTAQIASVYDNVNAMGTQIFGINNTLSSIAGRLTAVETKANTTEANVASLTNSVSTLNSAVNTLSGRITANTNDIQTLINDMSDVTSRLVSLESSIGALQAAVGAHTSAISNLVSEFNNHESRIVILEQEIIGDVPTTVFVASQW